METKFKFNSQICTDRFQSERLLALGLKKETADMCSVIDHVSDGGKWEEVDTIFSFTPDDWNFRESVTPRWSLHRLLSMLPDDAPKIYWILDGANISMEWENDDSDFFPHRGNMYNGIISCIEWLIKEGYFNKEYLWNDTNKCGKP